MKKYIVVQCPYCGVVYVDYINIKKNSALLLICPLCQQEISIG